MLPSYAELHCRSNFRFLTGASHPAEPVLRAQALGHAALAITDECSLAGVVRAHLEAQRCEAHLIIGADMRLTAVAAGLGAGVSGQPGPADADAVARHPPRTGPRLVLLAQTRRGYGNLLHGITVARRRAARGACLAHASDVEGRVPNAPFLAGLPECIAPLVPELGRPFETVFAHAVWLKTWFADRAYIAIELLHRAGEQALPEVVRRVAELTGLPIVASGDALMHLRSRKALQDALIAARLATPVAQCGLGLRSNAELHLRSRGRLAAPYEPQWLANTLVVAGRCSFSLAQLRCEYPREIVPAGHTPQSWLRVLTGQGALRRYPAETYPEGVPAKVLAAIEHELELIGRLECEPVFLTVADIVQWARDQRILRQGRGSAANSAVCFCLGVTEVNPMTASMLFERFTRAERGEPPDIDFEPQRREEAIQCIYGKYGRHRAARTGVVICYRPRSALRDVGRTLGIDLQRIDGFQKPALVRQVKYRRAAPARERLRPGRVGHEAVGRAHAAADRLPRAV